MNHRPGVEPQEDSQDYLTSVIRIIGVAVLLAGLFSASHVVKKAWALIENPASIAPFAEEIEKQTHLNSFLLDTQREIIDRQIEAANQALNISPQAPANAAIVRRSSSNPPNPSFIAAWLLVLPLLALIGRISLWAVTEGGKLAAYGWEYEKSLRRIMGEFRRDLQDKVKP